MKENVQFKKKQKNKISEPRIIEIWVSPKLCIYIDEWYLEEIVDIVKQFPNDKYKKFIDYIKIDNNNKSFPQESLASHNICEKHSRFNEFQNFDQYINETWFNNIKESLLKVSNVKGIKLEKSIVGSSVDIPSFLNNISPKNMFNFKKQNSNYIKSATILINVNGHMSWQDYKKIIRQFFKIYTFINLSIGNISYVRENDIDYYRITVVKIRNGVNINGQGLVFESADFLRRIMFLIYEIEPTKQYWKAYGNTISLNEIEKLKIDEPYFATILNKYLNSYLIVVE